MNFNKNLLQAARREWLALASTIIMGFAGGIAIILQARQLSLILDRVFLGGLNRPQVTPLFFPLLVILFLRALFMWLAEVSAGTLAIRIKTRLRTQLMHKILSRGPAFVHAENSGELTNTAVQGIESLDAYFSQYLPQIALSVLLPIAILVAVFPLDWVSGLVMLLTAPLIPVFMILIGRASEAATKHQWNTLSRLSTYFLDTLQGLRELKMLGQSRARAEKIMAVSDQYRLKTMNVLRITFLSALVLELIGTISTAVIAVQIGLRLLYGRMAFEQAFFILLLAPEFYLPLRQLGARFHAGANGIQAARRIFSILAVPDLTPAEPHPHSKVEIGVVQQIEFSNVSYSHPGQTTPAVVEINLRVRSGEMVALVGPTGAGKSTLAHLLMGFARPESGEIFVNGISLTSIDPLIWRRQVAWVPQQPVLFQGSLAENIALGKPDASLQHIEQAARLAHLDRLIDSLRDGYHTRIEEFGQRLSGGEIQKVALARAFLVDAPVLILDEPSAHLDPDTEAELEEAAQRLRDGRTVIVIAHRLPTVYRSNQILVLDHGRIIERGSHFELIKAGGTYARLLRDYKGTAA